ncbi:hypothetical protein HK100_012612 [Physocladia obscura]|uniref:Tryptophan synthase beta chain-like PALP domain-containing protein n=1 Tax=Physocladia obscura TaxID=109957 RepID=A0AAD5T0I1_9FUNG|nr:hypothetical protein HK100_012612 [Physocladia obscura]
MSVLLVILVVVSTLAVVAATVFLFFLGSVLSRIYHSIKPHVTAQPPSLIPSLPLFRHFPATARVAFRPLANFPSPVHRIRIPQSPVSNGKDLVFSVKRDDLVSTSLYSGNKVRTLQFVIASCEAHQESYQNAKLFAIGSAGSNQVVCALTYGKSVGVNVDAVYLKSDLPDLDNALNVVSALSIVPKSRINLWDNSSGMWKLLNALFRSGPDRVFGMGGNSIAGTLGQINGALELAEQIESGQIADIDALYLPIGSSCTFTGLILGICLAQYRGIKAFQSPDFKIVAVPIHHTFAGLHRSIGIYKAEWSSYIPTLPKYNFHHVSAFLKSIGAIDSTFDLEAAAGDFLTHHVDIVADEDIVGLYGVHSTRSLRAASYDTLLQVFDGTNKSEWSAESQPPVPWICGHFVGKPFAVLLNDLERNTRNGVEKHLLLWQTKSAIQPKGPVDEWMQVKEVADDSKEFGKWLKESQPHSLLRRGYIDVADGKPEDYQFIMKETSLI